MKKDDSVYLMHILDGISRIEEYTRGIRYEDFMDNHLMQDRVIRQIEIIDEATKRLSKEIGKKHPEIPWKYMAGMRGKLIPDYFGVDLDATWDTVEKDIPALKNRLRDLIEKGFKRFKRALKSLPLNTQKDSTTKGFLFICFIGLIIKMRLLHQMKETGLIKEYTVEKLLLELEKIKKIRLTDGEMILTEITKSRRGFWRS